MSKNPTKAERARMESIGNGWCLPCLIKNRGRRQATVQHVCEGSRRLGHMYTYGSCPWHHQAVNESQYTTQEMIGLLGPSFAHGRGSFEREYGDERDVLVRLQDWVLKYGNGYDHHELHSQWQFLRKTH